MSIFACEYLGEFKEDPVYQKMCAFAACGEVLSCQGDPKSLRELDISRRQDQRISRTLANIKRLLMFDPNVWREARDNVSRWSFQEQERFLEKYPDELNFFIKLLAEERRS